MNRLKKLIREVIFETYEESSNPFHIIVLIDNVDIRKIGVLSEGIWKPSGEKDYWKRLDTRNFDFEQVHIHIAKQKHINTKNKQVSWNVDGTRHDKKTFNNNFNGMEAAKKIARKALGLSGDVKLEHIQNNNKGQLLLEGIEYLPVKCSVYVFKANLSDSQILKG